MRAYNGDLWGKTPQRGPGRAPGGGVKKPPPLKLETFELADTDTKQREKSVKIWIFWTRSSAQVEHDSTVFARDWFSQNQT